MKSQTSQVTRVIVATLGLVLSHRRAGRVRSARAGRRPMPSGRTPARKFAKPLADLSSEPMGDDPRARILRWNDIAMAATALDHTPPPAGDPRVFREQFGPGREAKALAIVQIAVFDAVNAVTGNRFRSYTGLRAPCAAHRVERGHRAGRPRHAGGALARADGDLRHPARGRPRRVPRRRPEDERHRPRRASGRRHSRAPRR